MSYLGIYDLTGATPDSRYQGTTGTTPSIDRIGRAVDLSGNERDLTALDDAGRPKAQVGYALYDNYTDHRLASSAFSYSGSETYVAVRFRQDDYRTQGNLLIQRGSDDSGLWVAGDQGNGNFRIVSPSSGTILSEVTTTSGDHTLEVWAGTPGRYSLDGGPILDADNDWTDGLQRLVVGGSGVNITNRSWEGRIYRVVAKPVNPEPTERIAIQLWLSGQGPLPINPPPTEEEAFRSLFADASGRDPYVSALSRGIDAQRLINHNVSLWAGRPGRWKGQPRIYEVPAEIRYGELRRVRPGQVVYMQDDQPGLTEGRYVRVLSAEGGARPGTLTLTCIGWDDDDNE